MGVCVLWICVCISVCVCVSVGVCLCTMGICIPVGTCVYPWVSVYVCVYFGSVCNRNMECVEKEVQEPQFKDSPEF